MSAPTPRIIGWEAITVYGGWRIGWTTLRLTADGWEDSTDWLDDTVYPTREAAEAVIADQFAVAGQIARAA